MKKLLVVFCISIISFMGMQEVNAASMYGGEISWTCVGQDSFIVSLTVYRDCNGVPMGSAQIPIKCATTSVTITTLNISKPTPIDITSTCGASCTRCQSSGCSFPYGIEQYTYTQLVVLTNAGSCCKVQLSYSYCCRNSAVTTGITGMFYIDATLDRCLTPCDNSPTFSSPPITIICIGQDFVFNHGASDVGYGGASADSLSYEWTSPLSASGTAINYSGQYTYEKPTYFWGFPNANLPFPRGYHLDAVNGNIGFRPMKIEQTAMVLKIKQWRKINGNMLNISEQTRDYSCIVISCPNNNSPVLSGPFSLSTCGGDTLKFTITTNDYDTKDSLRLSYDNSIANAIWSDNNSQVKHPTGILKIPTTSADNGKSGTFTVTVEDDACPINGRSSRQYQYNVSGINISPPQIIKTDLSCGSFSIQVFPYYNTLQYKWSSTLTPPNSIQGNSNIIYTQINDAGNYPFELKITSNCDTLIVYDTLKVNATALMVEIPDTIFISKNDSFLVSPVVKNIHGTLSFQWSDNDNIHLTKWFHYKENMRPQLVSLTAYDSSGCSKLALMVVVSDTLFADCGPDKFKCNNNNATLSASYFSLKGSYTIKYYKWYKKGNPTPLSFKKDLTTKDTGYFICSIEFNNGIIKKDTVMLSDYPITNIDAGNDITICSGDGLYELKGVPDTGSFYWSGTAISENNGTYYFDPENASIQNGGNYYAHFYYTDQYGCKTYDDKRITVYYSSAKPEVGQYPTLCEKDAKVQLISDLKPGTWSGNGIVDNEFFNPLQAGAGTHELIYKVGNYCPNYDTTFITVLPRANISLNTEYGKTKFCRSYGLVRIDASPAGGIFRGPLVNGNYFNTDTLHGLYQIYYIYADSTSCIDSQLIEIAVVDPEVKITNNDTLCLKNYIELTSENNFSSAIEWTKGPSADGHFEVDISKQNIQYYLGKNDSINKEVWIFIKTIDSVCNSILDSMKIKLLDSPIANFTADDPIYMNYYKVKFYDSSQINTGSIVDYYWDFGDGKFAYTRNTTHNYYNQAVFDVSLTVTADNGCFDTELKANFINLNLIGVREKNNIPTIKLYPNPSSADIHLVTDFKMKEIIIYNSIGELIEKKGIMDYRFTIQNPGKGLYYLKIMDVKDNLYIEKVIFN